VAKVQVRKPLRVTSAERIPRDASSAEITTYDLRHCFAFPSGKETRELEARGSLIE
jgi:hypothetical protein